MVTTATMLGVVFVCTGGGLFALLRDPIRHPEKPVSRWFALAVVGISLWPLSSGVNYFLADRSLSILVWNGRVIAATVTSASWFLLAVEYTTRDRPSRPLLAAMGAYFSLEVLLTVTNPVHHLLLTEGTRLAGTVLVPDYGAWFWLRTAVNYGLIVLATAILAVEWSRSSGLQRRQSAILTVAVVPPIVANLLTLSSAIPSIYDLTPFGLVGSGILLTWALYRVEFLDVVPVARKTAMEEMRDAVVTLDEERRVVDCNAAARDLFDVDGYYHGTPSAAFFATLPPYARTGIAQERGFETEVAIPDDGAERHFSISVSPVRLGEDVGGRVVVLRDVTPLVARERVLEERQGELDLLRQVLTRVLRHNLRNGLTTIHGNAQILAEDLHGEPERRAERILAATDDLETLSEKAAHVERIVADGEAITYDLSRIAADVVDDCRDRYPAVSFETDLSDSVAVEAGPGLEVAVEALVENAADYGDPDAPRVSVTVEAGPRLRVEDNGDGIPEAEVAVLEAHEETPLEHGSGIGLWLAKLVADHADADLSFSVDDGGTTVRLDFDDDRSAVSRTTDDLLDGDGRYSSRVRDPSGTGDPA